jgi:phage-related protein
MNFKGKPLAWLEGVDRTDTWRIIYRIDPDVIVIAEVFTKKTQKTPADIVEAVKKRLRAFDEMD